MSSLEALLLGIVQGLTEFLPISSSGHLILVPWLQDYRFLLDDPEFNKTFDVALHAGTLIAVVSYFRTEVVELTRGFLSVIRKRAAETTSERLSVAIAIGTIPAVIFGALGAGFIDEHLGEPWMIAIQLIFFALLLGVADSLPERRAIDTADNRDGLVIGLAQVLSLAPGTSRSGITITAARFLGLDRDSAARFSFLLLVPVTAGAVIFKGAEALSAGLPPGVVRPMIVGMIGAAVSGFLAIAFLLRMLRTMTYRPFVYYRLVVGVAVLLIIATSLRPATF